MIEQNKNNIKRTWSVLKITIGNNNDTSSITQSFNIKNVNITDKTEIGEAFNNNLSKIGQSIRQNVPKSKRNYNDFLKNPLTNSIFFEPIDTSCVIEAENKLKPKLSTGRDDIFTKLLKETIHNFKLPITHIINRPCSTCFFPDTLKIAKVIQIYKTLNKGELKHYRPISFCQPSLNYLKT
jgi:hypothetical protein